MVPGRNDGGLDEGEQGGGGEKGWKPSTGFLLT